MADATYNEMMANSFDTPYFGQMMLRDAVLPSLLGSRSAAILYFAGRDLAQKLPLADDAISGAFAQLGLGTLAATKTKVRERHYTLTGMPVTTRLAQFPQADFQFEAGLLAQLVQQALGMSCEAFSEVNGQQVDITLTIDPSEEQTLYTDM